MVTLRALEPEDLQLLYTIENDTAQWWVGTQTAPYSRYRLRDYIANSDTDIYKDEQVRFVVEEDGHAVGLVDLFNFSPIHHRAELGIALLQSARGHGVARQALRLVADYAQRIVHMQQIYCIIPESHEASLRMLNDCGYQHAAVLKNWLFTGRKYENAVLMQLFLG